MKEKEKKYLLGNKPIEKESEDLFNFINYSSKIQNLIQRNSNNREPITFGIYGKWGEGKTSFLNLIESEIDIWSKEDNQKGILKYHFNPWRYSTEDEMLFDFFDGLSKLMILTNTEQSNKISDGITSISRYLKSLKISHTVGIPQMLGTKITYEPSKILEALGERKNKNLTINQLVNQVNQHLNQSNYKVIVFIDDIDRLDKNEIYTILKLIKLNANFNHFVYLITLDEEHVSKSIGKRYGKSKKDGKLFLEKIINIPIHVPRIEETDLKYFFELKLDEIKKNLFFKDSSTKNEDFQDILSEYWTINFKSPREIIKILNSFFIDAFSIGEEVNLRDLFWLSVLKVKNSECYNYLKNFYNKGVFQRSEIIDFCDDINSREKINGKRLIIEEKYPDEKYIIDLLFPLREDIKIYDYPEETSQLRINYSQNFDSYFSFNKPKNISSSKIFDIKQAIKNEDSIELKRIVENAFKTKNSKKELLRFENLIRSITYEENRLFLFNFIFGNLELIPNIKGDSFNDSYHHRIVRGIAESLSGSYDGQSEGLIFEMCKKLDVNLLSFFKRYLGDKLDKKIGTLIVEKAKELTKSLEPIYKNEKENIFVLHYWSKHDPSGLKEYINSTLTNTVNLKLLIRNFAPYYNNEFYGAISLEDLDYIKSLIDIDYLLNRIKKFAPKIYNQTIYSNSKLPDKYSRSTAEENLMQLVFWYNYSKNNTIL